MVVRDKADGLSNAAGEGERHVLPYHGPQKRRTSHSAEGFASFVGGCAAVAGIAVVLTGKLPEAHQTTILMAAFLISMWGTVFGLLGLRHGGADDPFAVVGFVTNACVLVGGFVLGVGVCCFSLPSPFAMIAFT